MGVIAKYFLTVVMAALPAFIWISFFLKGDVHPEPKKILALTFAAGALASIPAFFLEIVFQGIAQNFLCFMCGIAAIEEILKFLSAYFVNARSKYLDEPVDTTVYSVTAALGFATIENFIFIRNSLVAITSSTIFSAFILAFIRFIGATLLHVIASATSGYGWGLSKFQQRKTMLLVGITTATLLHAAFNLLTVRFQTSRFFYPAFFTVSLIILSSFINIERRKVKKETP